MESINYHDESTNSSEEAMDHSDEENSDLGVGRSYECVFCKRGFNTAQALGGHMNIHRKHRARNNPNSNKQPDQQICYTRPRLYQQLPSSSTTQTNYNQSANHPFASQDHRPILSYATYFPESSTSRNKPLYGSSDFHLQNDSDHDHRQPTNPLIHGDWRMRLSLEFPTTRNRQVMNEEKDLDLELRLGYDS